MSSSTEQAGVIASINEQVDNINATIEDLKAADVAIGQAIGTLQAEDEAIRAQLEADKANIGASIDSLENYVNKKLQDAQDWATATFATLEQFQHLCDSVAAVKQSLEDMDARITAQLKHDIDSLETSMKAWVNEQLAGYYTIAQMDAKLEALEKTVQDGDKANADAITQLQADLAKQATDLASAYEAAIAAAIAENNGVIDGKIATEITAVNTRITNEVKTISDRIDAMELRIQAVEDYINSQKAFTISFTMPKDTVCFPGETITVGYEVSESTLPTLVECIPDAGWNAAVQSNGNKGTITISAPDEGGNGKIVVFANRSSWILMATLLFEEGVISIEKDEYPAPAGGGTLVIPFSINANYGIKVAEADKSWLHYNETKSAMRNETLSLTVDANPNQFNRVGKVYIYPEEGNNDEYYELKINQAAAFFTVSPSICPVRGTSNEIVITINTSLSFKINVPVEADWISVAPATAGNNTFKIVVSCTANDGDQNRTAVIDLVSTDGLIIYGTITIIQTPISNYNNTVATNKLWEKTYSQLGLVNYGYTLQDCGVGFCDVDKFAYADLSVFNYASGYLGTLNTDGMNSIKAYNNTSLVADNVLTSMSNDDNGVLVAIVGFEGERGDQSIGCMSEVYAWLDGWNNAPTRILGPTDREMHQLSVSGDLKGDCTISFITNVGNPLHHVMVFKDGRLYKEDGSTAGLYYAPIIPHPGNDGCARQQLSFFSGDPEDGLVCWDSLAAAEYGESGNASSAFYVYPEGLDSLINGTAEEIPLYGRVNWATWEADGRHFNYGNYSAGHVRAFKYNGDKYIVASTSSWPCGWITIQKADNLMEDDEETDEVDESLVNYLLPTDRIGDAAQCYPCSAYVYDKANGVGHVIYSAPAYQNGKMLAIDIISLLN